MLGSVYMGVVKFNIKVAMVFSDGFFWTYVHHEVLEVLSGIVGAHCIVRNIYSPYYYGIGQSFNSRKKRINLR